MSTGNSGADDGRPSNGPLTSDARPSSRSIDITLSPLSDSTWLSPGSASEPPAIARDFLPGYDILRELHRGGQGIVFLAHQKSVQRNVAIKVMKEGPFADATDRARFDREVRILAQLQHPNIVTIHDSGRVAGCDYFIMDYVPGMSLEEYVEQKKPPIRELLELFRTICETVEVAHARKVIHRDLKPGNIRVDTEGRPRVLDFGLAKVVGAARASNATEQGMFVGSIPWASPEQARGELETLDPRTDVYSLGVILYQLLTGRFPYDVLGPPHEVLDRIITADPLSPRSLNKQIDRDLETIILKCLAKERNRRYASAGALASDLSHLLSDEPIDAKRTSVSYLIRKRARGLVRGQSVATQIGVVAIVFMLAKWPGMPLVYRWTNLDWAFRALAVRSFVAPPPPGAFQDVRIVTFSENTPIATLARNEGLVGVSAANPQSLRRLHGALLKRLAVASPRAVAFDLRMRKPSEFDGDFVAGVRAMRAAGVDIVINSPSWALDSQGLPEISPEIMRDVKWGPPASDFTPRNTWALELFMQRPGRDPQPSFVLASVAAFQQPQTETTLDCAEEGTAVELRYWKPNPNVPRARLWPDMATRIPLTARMHVKAASKLGDLQPGDAKGIFALRLPTSAVLASATIEYADLFNASEQRLRELVHGRLLVIGDARKSADDDFKTPDGRTLAGCVGQAIGADAILSGNLVRRAFDRESLMFNLVGALLGCAIGIRWPGRTSRRLIALLGVTLIAVAAALTAYRLKAYFADPIVPIGSVWLACELSALAGRMGTKPRSSTARKE